METLIKIWKTIPMPEDVTVTEKRIGVPVGYRRPTDRRSVDYLVTHDFFATGAVIHCSTA